MTGLHVEQPWLELRFPAPRRVLGWTLNKPGFHMADRLLWREVRNADLTPDLDVPAWLASELAARGALDAPCFLTSRDVRRVVEARAQVDGITAHCVATVGLSNAERIGTRMGYGAQDWGTINIAVDTDQPLTEAGLIEALSLVAQARTAAVLEDGPILPTGRATGTGTDCITVAAPVGDTPFAGLHTAVGEAIGKATHMAMTRGVADWMEERYGQNDSSHATADQGTLT